MYIYIYIYVVFMRGYLYVFYLCTCDIHACRASGYIGTLYRQVLVAIGAYNCHFSTFSQNQALQPGRPAYVL